MPKYFLSWIVGHPYLWGTVKWLLLLVLGTVIAPALDPLKRLSATSPQKLSTWIDHARLASVRARLGRIRAIRSDTSVSLFYCTLGLVWLGAALMLYGAAGTCVILAVIPSDALFTKIGAQAIGYVFGVAGYVVMLKSIRQIAEVNDALFAFDKTTSKMTSEIRGFEKKLTLGPADNSDPAVQGE